jgi:chemotaxis protein methyltransferase CheR
MEQEMVRDQMGATVLAERKTLFEMKLAPVARLANAANLQQFVNLLRHDETQRLRRSVAEAMAIHSTSFFRDEAPFEMLRREIVPELMRMRGRQRRLRVWSAACSTGQEVYSVAMLLREHFPELAEWDVTILGTDVSQDAVSYARRGLYKQTEVDCGLPVSMLDRYMRRDGGVWEVCSELREMCEFRCLDLCDKTSGLPGFDLVLLRNVLLYLPDIERTGVLRDVWRQMSRYGYLMLGQGEQAEDWTRVFEVELAGGSCCYRPLLV